MITVTVNNQDWGRVDQVSSSFACSCDQRPAGSNYNTVYQECSGTVTQFTAVPNAGYRFLKWTEIKSTVHYWGEDRHKVDGSVYNNYDHTYTRTKTEATANPLGYTLADTAAWNSTLFPPPYNTGFSSVPNQIGLSSYLYQLADQNYNPQYDSIGDNYVTWDPISLQANFTPIQIIVRFKYRMLGNTGDVTVGSLSAQDAGTQITLPTYTYSIPQSGDTSFAGTDWAWNRHWKDETTGNVYKLGDTFTLPKPVYSGENTVYLDLYAVFRHCTMLPTYLPSNGLLLRGTGRRTRYIIRDGDPGL